MNDEIVRIKQRFGIIGNSEKLNRAINIALQVASTDMSVLITGESGVGKEVFPKIIHHYSSRKHAKYIAVNCGAIPEGTIDSELFGHEKGAFTGATDSRKGYFEVANNGTIFLDEVGELPLSTQVRLLRVLEAGEFIKVGSSKVQKTDVRVVAATNVNVEKAVREGHFREDLYYRLNTVPISIPSLRERREDVWMLFKKFANDVSEKYTMPTLRLDEQAYQLLENYEWPGNIRQLKNITEQIAIIEQNRLVTTDILKHYLPNVDETRLPAIVKSDKDVSFANEREILYKILFDMKSDMNDLKQLVNDILSKGVDNVSDSLVDENITSDFSNINRNLPTKLTKQFSNKYDDSNFESQNNYSKKEIIQDTEEIIEESLSLVEKEKELIIKALNKHNGRRKLASKDLGISERTLYRKIKEYEIE